MRLYMSTKNLFVNSYFWVFLISSIVIVSVFTPIGIILRKRKTPIIIKSNEDFLKYDLPGTGTEIDPYRIENRRMIINDFVAIMISNISKFVLIQNNQINSKSNERGIVLGVSIPGLIEIRNNIFENCLEAIHCIRTYECVIKNNIFKNGKYGIGAFSFNYANDHLNFLIQNNTFINIENEEIGLLGAGGTIIKDNTCSFNTSEMQEYDKAYERPVGFLIYNLNGTVIRNNTLAYKGIELIDSDPMNYHSAEVVSNIVRGKEVGYFLNLNGSNFDENLYSQLFLINCTNILVKNQTSNFTGIGVCMVNCSNSAIQDSDFRYNGYAGIYISESNFITVNNNYFDSNYRGLRTLNSFNITVSNNSFNNGRYGCEFVNSTYILLINTFSGNEVDIRDVD